MKFTFTMNITGKFIFFADNDWWSHSIACTAVSRCSYMAKAWRGDRPLLLLSLPSEQPTLKQQEVGGKTNYGMKHEVCPQFYQYDVILSHFNYSVFSTLNLKHFLINLFRWLLSLEELSVELHYKQWPPKASRWKEEWNGTRNCNVFFSVESFPHFLSLGMKVFFVC